MPAADDLGLLVAAARDAGEIARRYFRRDPAVQEKPEGGGPVTEADLAIDAMLRERLTAARPGYGWLSEETPDSPARLEAARAFVVDPIDGTRAFIEGNAAFAHSLAVVEAGRVIAAAVYLPMSDLMYSARAGGGAHLNGTGLRVSERDSLEAASVLATRSNFEPWFWAEADVPRVNRQFRSSLAYRLSLVAEGRHDAMLTLRPAWEWDIAAGALLVEEAGGRVTDRRGRALAFNAARPQLDGVVAAGPRLHDEITRRLA